MTLGTLLSWNRKCCVPWLELLSAHVKMCSDKIWSNGIQATSLSKLAILIQHSLWWFISAKCTLLSNGKCKYFWHIKYVWLSIAGLMQERRNSIANALALLFLVLTYRYEIDIQAFYNKNSMQIQPLFLCQYQLRLTVPTPSGIRILCTKLLARAENEICAFKIRAVLM